MIPESLAHTDAEMLPEPSVITSKVNKMPRVRDCLFHWVISY